MNMENVEVENAVQAKRRCSYFERWGGWLIVWTVWLLDDLTDPLCKLIPNEKAAFAVSVLKSMALFIGGALWYLNWFERNLGKTVTVNLSIKGDTNGKED